MRLILLPSIIVVLLAASAWSGVTAAADSLYRLDTGDVITVTVWGHADLGAQAAVRPDGRVSLPLLGEVVVRGSTLEEVRQFVESGLSVYVREPRVTVSLVTRRQISVQVLGEVARPGAFLVHPDASIAEVIAMAGGPTRRAALEAVQHLAGGDPSQAQLYPQGRRNKFGKGEAVRGPALADGDVILVPETDAWNWERIFAFLAGLLTVKELTH